MLYRNQNSHFAENPSASIERSTFNRSHSVKFSFNAGDLVPFLVEEVLPGDTFSIDTNKLVRMQSLITPCMDNIYLDTYYFFVPNRLVCDKWKNIMGENTESPWIPNITYTVPRVTCPNGGWKLGSLADYMGIPINVDIDQPINSFPFKAYALIWNEWFRDQNLQYPQAIDRTTEDVDGKNIEDLPDWEINIAQSGAGLLKAAKFKDYFTSCLPAPQKGPDVLVPIGDMAPVITSSVFNSSDYFPREGVDEPIYGLKFYNTISGEYFTPNTSQKEHLLGVNTDGLVDYQTNTTGSTSPTNIVPANLVADLNHATAATVNQLRLAFQIQKLYERDARSGTRYIEQIYSHFGVTSPDSRLQRPEYLGGNRMLINVNQVIQTSESANTPQGNAAAYSLTVDSHSDFTHSFVEHGFLIGVCVARYQHTYQQGLDRFWTRRNRLDYYFPVLANIGEQPVYKTEIYADSIPGEVFGYQEAWADYRYKPNRVCAEMRSGIDNSLDVWHLADYYDEKPHLSSTWIQEDTNNLNRVLAVNSSVSNQFFADFYIENKATRPMPLFSIPGLIDHH